MKRKSQQQLQLFPNTRAMGNYQSSAKNKPELLLRITAGQTQSLELFDYQAKNGQSIQQKIVSPSYLIYNSQQKIQYTHTLADTSVPIFHFRVQGNDISISSYAEDQQLWRVINPDQQYMLDRGDQIKIGKIKLTFKEIVHEEEKQLTQKSIPIKNHQIQEDSYSDISGKVSQCRICFERTDTKANPLTCLCKCSGSVKYIHFECLRDWIKTSVLKRQSAASYLLYSYFQPSCQLCKHPYDMEFLSDGKKYSLIDLQGAPPIPRAIFQNIQLQEGKKKKTVLMIGLQSNQITIGRNGTSQVVLKQISVSRIHCSLLYRNGRLFIRDKNSKFGTLIKVITSLPFSSLTGLELQFQSKLLQIRDAASTSCCCAQSDSYMLKLQNQVRATRAEDGLFK